MTMISHPVVSRDQWEEARRRLLQREKAFTRERDALSAQRRGLPWVRIDKPYSFDTESGRRTLAELFGPCSQLIVYHFMLGADWHDPCRGCSFIADTFNGLDVHLRARDVTLVAASSARLDHIRTVKQRMGWTFPWVSSGGSDFNRDFHVSFTPEELAAGEVEYNYRMIKLGSTEQPGLSVFYKDPGGGIFHTYSCYSRGLDPFMGAYHLLDVTPKGRDEAGLRPASSWLRLRDRYGESE